MKRLASNLARNATALVAVSVVLVLLLAGMALIRKGLQ